MQLEEDVNTVGLILACHVAMIAHGMSENASLQAFDMAYLLNGKYNVHLKSQGKYL